MRELRDQHEFRIISESEVIFSSLDSSSKFSIARNIKPISTLIVDEATLSVESSMNTPFLYLFALIVLFSLEIISNLVRSHLMMSFEKEVIVTVCLRESFTKNYALKILLC